MYNTMPRDWYQLSGDWVHLEHGLFWACSISIFVVCGLYVDKTSYYVLGSIVLAGNTFVFVKWSDDYRYDTVASIGASICNLFALYIVGDTFDENADKIHYLVLQTAYTLTTVLYAAQIGWPPDNKNYTTEPLIQRYLKTEAFLRLVFDYAISASVMLSVISLLWGCRSYAGIYVGPSLLCSALIASWYVLDRARSTDTDDKAFLRAIHLLHLIVVYTAALWPLFGALYNGLKSADTELPSGQMPSWVVVIAIANMTIFSAFIVPYGLDLFAKKYVCFISHAVLSVVAKVMLHAFLGISILAQVNELSDAECSKEFGADNQLGRVSGIVGGTIVGGCLLAFVLKKYFDPLAEDVAVVATAYNDTKTRTQEEKDKHLAKTFFRVHMICGTMHLVSLSVLLATALNNTDISTYKRAITPRFWAFDTWYYKCFDPAAETCYDNKMCHEDNRHYYIANTGTSYVNIVVLASVYVAISGIVHIFTAFFQYRPECKTPKCTTRKKDTLAWF